MPEPAHALQRKLATIASARGSKGAPENGSIRLVMTAPPIIDGGWFQALAIINWVCKEAVTRTFSLGQASRLEELFREGGFPQIETHTVRHTFVLPSFDAYYGRFERRGASAGQALAALRGELRRAVHDEVRRDFGDTSGQI